MYKIPTIFFEYLEWDLIKKELINVYFQNNSTFFLIFLRHTKNSFCKMAFSKKMKDKSTQFPEIKDTFPVIDPPLPMFVPSTIASKRPQDANYYYYYPSQPKITIFEYQSQPIPYLKTIIKIIKKLTS